MDMNFTIIIPHRNIPLLLERLINSIPVRDDLEIIIADDHSSPDIVDFDHFPGEGRPNLTVQYYKENHGAGYVRNRALPLAKGKWIIQADADDFFNDGFNDFLNDYLDSSADVVYFNANSIDNVTLESTNRVDHLHGFFDSYHKDPVRGELEMRYLFSEPWCKMVKRSLIEEHGIDFFETIKCHDVKYSYLVGHYANQVIIDDRQLYCVIYRVGSACQNISLEAHLDEMKVFSFWKKFLIDHKVPLDLPKFDLLVYHFSRHLYKDNYLFRKEYKIMKEAGFSHAYIQGQIIKYLWKSVGYKTNRFFKF